MEDKDKVSDGDENPPDVDVVIWNCSCEMNFC